jgi:hypothetical protein
MSWGTRHGYFENNVEDVCWDARSEVVVNTTKVCAEGRCVFEAFGNNGFGVLVEG